MATEVISRKDALAKGLKRYFTGRPCRYGHLEERSIANHGCLKCQANNATRWRKSHPERTRESDLKFRFSARRKEISKRHYAKKADVYREKARRRSKERPQEVNAANKRWRNKNIEKCRAYSRRQSTEWRKANPEERREICKRWRDNNPESGRECVRRRRARKAGAVGAHTRSDLSEILKLQKNKCAHCRIVFGEIKPTLDHITALARGGSNDRRNLQFLCKSCNSSKQAQDPLEFARKSGRLI